MPVNLCSKETTCALCVYWLRVARETNMMCLTTNASLNQQLLMQCSKHHLSVEYDCSCYRQIAHSEKMPQQRRSQYRQHNNKCTQQLNSLLATLTVTSYYSNNRHNSRFFTKILPHTNVHTYSTHASVPCMTWTCNEAMAALIMGYLKSSDIRRMHWVEQAEQIAVAEQAVWGL